MTAETSSMPTLKFLVICLDLFLCCTFLLTQTAVFLSASPLCSMFVQCVHLFSQALFCKAKQSSFSSLLRLLSIPFFICSPCSLCVLCAQYCGHGQTVCHILLWVRSYKCTVQCHPCFTVPVRCVISHASLDLIFLFLWLCDVSDLGTLEIHWCPVAKLISAGSCLYCWAASFFCFQLQGHISHVFLFFCLTSHAPNWSSANFSSKFSLCLYVEGFSESRISF